MFLVQIINAAGSLDTAAAAAASRIKLLLPFHNRHHRQMI